MPDFLLEIGCEEIPARMITAAEGSLSTIAGHTLKLAHLLASGMHTSSLSTPRRLAVMVSGIPAAQPDVTERIVGPAATVAYKDGQPTQAAHGFAKKAGIDISQLEIVSTHKGDCIVAKITKKGRNAVDALAENLPKGLASIYWPKNMYWREPNERFVRPVRWLVAMLDGEVIPLEFDGIRAGNQSRGHRILSHGAVTVPHAGREYFVNSLRAAKVLDYSERKVKIVEALDRAAGTITGARSRKDAGYEDLLDTVINLTEFPSVILGGFDPLFLALPEEVLVTVMRDHQKYFAVEDAAGKLLPHFLAVLNTDGDPQGLIRHGNERVLRARFNDARFFWQTDQKKSLLDRFDALRHVTFQKDLGSYYEKTRRVQRLCSWLCEIVKQGGIAVRAGVVHKAACLAKTDLTTELVKEFTELQGIVGGLYARVQPLDPSLPESTRFAIADAIYDHYKPESTEDEVPRSIEGAVLSVGDKADTIAGMFALGLVPSGSKDPFALRRQANAIVKVIDKYKLPFRLSDLMRDARAGYQGSEAEKKFVDDEKFNESVRIFFRERLEFYLKDVCGYAYDGVKAVLAADAEDVVDALARIEALSNVRDSAEYTFVYFEAISSAFRRMKNILNQAAEKKLRIAERVDSAILQLGAEKELARVIEQTAKSVKRSRAARDYDEALREIAELRPLIDNFFDDVMVMVDDDNLRANRLALLRTVVKEFSTIADFSEMVTESRAA